MKQQYTPLFKPMKIGSIEIKNRFILEPMEGTNIIECMSAYKYSEHTHDYYIERAKAGIGLMIPGMVTLQCAMNNEWLHNQKDVFKQVMPLIEEIHSYGSKVFFQIGAGWGRSFPMRAAMKDKKMDRLLVAPSPLPNRWLPEIKHRALTVDEIHEFVRAYALAAKCCKEAGVDGVEVHAVHEGYLLDQFTTKYTNQRTDEYGGSFENRYRFAAEVAKAIKEECGTEYPVSIRYSVTSKTIGFGVGAVPGEEYQEVGRDLEEGIRAAKYLQDAGYDMLNADNGTYDAWYWSHPPVYMPLNCNMQDVMKIKEVVDIPVVCAGRMQIEEGAKAIEDGKLDAMGIGRQFLCDPEYIVKIEEERLEDVLPCISCHNACLPLYHYEGIGGEIAAADMATQGHCALNPRTFREKKYTVTPVQAPKKIAVIGGGIGGLTVAMVAAKRGHKVTIYEKNHELGGVFIAAAAPSFKEKDKELIQWYERQIKKQQIEVKYNSEITDISQVEADEVIIATGAKPRTLNVPGSELCVEAIEYLREHKTVGEHIAVIGGGLTGCEIAYDLALKGKKPIIIEMMDDILMTKGLCMANSSCLRDLLRYYQVPVLKKARLKEVRNDAVLVETEKGVKTISVDSVITSCGYLPGTTLVSAEALETSDNIHILGDANKVGNLKNVIWDAYELAFAL